MPRALWLPDALRHFRLEPILVDGWDRRGSETFDPRGSVDHHTAGAAKGYMPSLGVLINGRPPRGNDPGVPGPLSNVGVPRSEPGDMRVYVVAAGRANHAGTGRWDGLSGNSSVLGSERENVGTSAEPWTEHRIDVAARVHAAFALGAGFDSQHVCEHKEWTPRKIDAHTTSGYDMRMRVEGLLAAPTQVETDPNAVIYVPEDDMLVNFVQVPLGTTGEGWTVWDTGKPVRGCLASRQGPFPPADGYWYESAGKVTPGREDNSPGVAASPRGNSVAVSVEGGKPRGTCGVWVAAF